MNCIYRGRYVIFLHRLKSTVLFPSLLILMPALHLDLILLKSILNEDFTEIALFKPDDKANIVSVRRLFEQKRL